MVTRTSLRSGLGPWLLDCCEIKEFESADMLYRSYELWSEMNGFGTLSNGRFIGAMRDVGFTLSVRTGHGMVILEIGLS